MTKIRKIGICTGGGDCPGLNAVIRAAVKTAILKYRYEVIGIRDGFDGLIWPEKSRPLLLNDVSSILPRGGTILGTTNRGNPFAYRVSNDGHETVRDFSDEVIRNAKTMGIDALIVIGGDGTQKIGLDLAQKGLSVVGVPKTIDNDLSATDVTFGFDSAIHVATDAIDRIHTTAESHHRIMIVEVMGRDAGWIALHAGIAGGAHIILLPEIPFSIESVCSYIEQRNILEKNSPSSPLPKGYRFPTQSVKTSSSAMARSPRASVSAI
jgi:6-phosphofructokinase 1